MPTIFSHEIQSFRTELNLIQHRYDDILNPCSSENLTHASFGVSNRENQMVVGLCSLVEVYLLDKAQGVNPPIKLDDLGGQGLNRLKIFLSQRKIIVFGNLVYWDRFLSVYSLRNSIVHSYGGMIVGRNDGKLVEHLRNLGLEHVLIGGRRIRLGTESLEIILNVVESLLKELGAYIEQIQKTEQTGADDADEAV